MPKFSANLSMLFTEVPFLERFGEAARAGFRGVEFLFPYEFPAATIRAELDAHGLELVLFNMPPGDWVKGDRGIACDPKRVGECRDGLAKAIDYAKALGCSKLHIMAGIAPKGVSAEAMHDAYVGNVRFAGEAIAAQGMSLMLEAINVRDVPGFYLNTSRQALAVIDEVKLPNVFFQFDTYHMQVMEGDLSHTLRTHLAKIGHVQIADTPGRHEPGTGEINYPFVFSLLDELGYTGWVGCEYRPATTTEAGLVWLAEAGKPGFRNTRGNQVS